MTQRKRAVNFILRVLCLLIAFACVTLLCWQYGVRKQGEAANEAMRQLYDPAASAEEALPRAAGPPFRSCLMPTRRPSPTSTPRTTSSSPSSSATTNTTSPTTSSARTPRRAPPFWTRATASGPLDEHILVHGHNMRDGSVFGDLGNFRDLEFLKENPITTFNTLYENSLYVPFAVFDMSATPGDQHYVDMRVFNFASDEDFLNFAFEAKDRSIFDIPVDVERGDHILSLVT